MAVRTFLQSQLSNRQKYNNFAAVRIRKGLEYIVIAGGGGSTLASSGSATYSGGGGGAGGYRSSVEGEPSGGGATSEQPLAVDTSKTYTVTVGAGGPEAGTAEGVGMGSDSLFDIITSLGGGNAARSLDNPAGDGGSGGGGTLEESVGYYEGGLGTANQGFAGGDGADPRGTGGGGGGAGSAGINGISGSNPAGGGGDGVASSITGTSVTRASGGDFGPTNTDANGVPGAANTGDGATGGGISGGGSVSGAAGGSGIVILRYPDRFTITIGAGLTGTTATVGDNKVTTITAGTGTFTLAVG